MTPGAAEDEAVVVVRAERPADYAQVAEVVGAAFGEQNEVRLVELIRASENYVPELALVAEEDGRVVGHAMFSYVTLRGAEEQRVLCLAPVAVAPERQRSGIGSALIRQGIETAEEWGEPLVIVEGHPGYYPRFGFEPASRYSIEPPSPNIPDAAFMVLRLSRYDGRYRGQVLFPAAFAVAET